MVYYDQFPVQYSNKGDFLAERLKSYHADDRLIEIKKSICPRRVVDYRVDGGAIFVPGLDDL